MEPPRHAQPSQLADGLRSKIELRDDTRENRGSRHDGVGLGGCREAHHRFGNGAFGHRAKQIAGRAERSSDPGDPRDESSQDLGFGRVSCKQVNHVYRTKLTDTIDAASTLLQAERAPWQLAIHHQAAAGLKVQAFAGRVGREQHSCGA